MFVSGNTNIQNNLIVTGNTILNNAITINSSLNISGITQLNQGLITNNIGALNDSLSFYSNNIYCEKFINNKCYWPYRNAFVYINFILSKMNDNNAKQ